MKSRIIQGDVLRWAHHYKGAKFHALLCDPPYECAKIADARLEFWRAMMQEIGSSDPRAILEIYDKMDKVKQDLTDDLRSQSPF